MNFIEGRPILIYFKIILTEKQKGDDFNQFFLCKNYVELEFR